MNPGTDIPFGGKPYVFISYSHKDSKTVVGYIKKLESMGYRIWYDEAIPYTSKYDNIIAQAISNCTLFTVFFTRGSAASEYVLDEVHTARDENKVIHPVFLEDVELPEGTKMRLRRFQQLRRSNFSSGQAFFDALRKPMEYCRISQAVKAVTARTEEAVRTQTQPQPLPTVTAKPKPQLLPVQAQPQATPAPVSVPVQPAKVPESRSRKPLYIAIAAAALVAVIVCGVIWLPGLVNNGNENQFQTEGQQSVVVSESDILQQNDDTVSETDIQQKESPEELTEEQVIKIKPLSELDKISVGDHLTFGNYPQSTDEPEPIEWRVLDVERGKALLISEYLLDAHRFDDNSNDWKTSEIRAWLNDDFLNNAFSSDEQKLLVKISGDKVSLLSYEEFDEYNSYNRHAKPTAYAKRHGAGYDRSMNTGWWWLRSSPSYNIRQNRAATINPDGYFDVECSSVDSSGDCIRPIIKVSF